MNHVKMALRCFNPIMVLARCCLADIYTLNSTLASARSCYSVDGPMQQQYNNALAHYCVESAWHCHHKLLGSHLDL